MNNHGNESKNILLIEDSKADILLLEEVLADCQRDIRLQVVHDGEEAMDFLHRRQSYVDAVIPHLIMLDLNLPRKDGFAVLSELKHDNGLKHIPVIVFSTSQVEDDINRSYTLHANCYVVKPHDLEGFTEVFNSICSFWLDTVRLPTGGK
jgi:two-component system response regulator